MPDFVESAIAALENVSTESSDFDLSTDVVLPEQRKLRPAGVLIILEKDTMGWQVYLTKRSSALKHHPGQVALPGGKQDDTDADITAAALREANEEIGLPTANIRIVGTLPTHETVTGFSVTPVIGLLNAPFDVVPEAGEVDEVFKVPLRHVLTPENYRVQSRRWQGRMRSYYAMPYGPYYIWGATARMLYGWANAIKA